MRRFTGTAGSGFLACSSAAGVYIGLKANGPPREELPDRNSLPEKQEEQARRASSPGKQNCTNFSRSPQSSGKAPKRATRSQEQHSE
jgi:hypothetical protein